MPWTILLVFAYGVVTILLGIVGFIHKGSVASLIAGGVSGLLVLLGGYLAKQHPRIGFGIVLVITILMLGRFGMNLAKNRDFYPDGVIVLTSVIGLIAAVAGLAGAGR